MVCARIVPRLSQANATILRTGYRGSASAKCGLAIYPDDDSGTALASGANDCTATGGVVSVTGLSAFTIVAGTAYRACVCATVSTTDFLGIYGTDTETILDLHSTMVANSTNTCNATTGAPPSTTGAMVSSNKGVPMMVVEH